MDVVVELGVKLFVIIMTYDYLKLHNKSRRGKNCSARYDIKEKVTRQLEHMHYLINYNDESYKNNLRMNWDCFNRLCYLLQNLGGLTLTRHVTIVEQVA